jgi:hypothetical protein
LVASDTAVRTYTALGGITPRGVLATNLPGNVSWVSERPEDHAPTLTLGTDQLLLDPSVGDPCHELDRLRDLGWVVDPR